MYNIASGQSSFQKNDLFLGKIPRRVLVGLVRNDAFVGHRGQNPCNFQLFHLKSLNLLVNGEEYPAQGIELGDNGTVNGQDPSSSGRSDGKHGSPTKTRRTLDCHVLSPRPQFLTVTDFRPCITTTIFQDI